jgi:hypothetical protein
MKFICNSSRERHQPDEGRANLMRLRICILLACAMLFIGTVRARAAVASPTDRTAIPVVPVKGTLVGQPVREFALTRDGSILADGRKVAAIVDAEVRDRRGELLFWLRADGALVDRFGNSQVRFAGDLLVDGDNRFVVAPSGRIVSVLPDGSEVAGRVQRGARYKRTVLVALLAALAAR